MAQKSSSREVVRAAYWREGDAREVIATWRRSGESRTQFCRRHGISVARLSRWVARLEGRPKTAAFYPVQVTPVAVARGGSDTLVVELPGVATIRLAPGFALEDLRRVLSAFEADAC